MIILLVALFSLLILDPRFNAVVSSEVICSSTSDVTVSLETLSKIMGTNTYRYSLKVDNLYNGVTACFDLTTPGGDAHRLAIKVSSLYGTANFEDQYEFGFPTVKAICTCSCKNILSTSECNPQIKDFCNGYSRDDRCITMTDKTSELKGCVNPGSSTTDYCCSIGIREDINNTFKAIKIRDQQQHNFKVMIYPDYKNEYSFHEQDQKMGEFVDVSKPGLIPFNEVRGEIQKREQIVNPSDWYIGRSKPYSPDVYESTEKLTAKSESDITKVGWAKFDSVRKRFNLDGPTDQDIENAFSATVENCGESKIETSFKSPKEDEFFDSLDTLKEKHSSYVNKVIWKNDGVTVSHGFMEWEFRESVIKTDLTFTFEGEAGDYKVEKVGGKSQLGPFTGEVVVSEHGNRFLRINLTDSKGTIKAKFYADPDRSELISFTFDVTDSNAQSKYYMDTKLKCDLNQPPRKLCLRTRTERCIYNVTCKETKIKEADIPSFDLVTDTVVSPGMSNLKSWLKYANPFEWFNGINSYQEMIMLIVEVAGAAGGVFLVLKVLKTMGLLGKCCRYMWCCFLCPKTEKKIRHRASTVRCRLNTSYYNAKGHMARRFTYSAKKKTRDDLSSEENQQIAEYMGRKSFVESRLRLGTDAVAKRLRRILSLNTAEEKEFGSKNDLIECEEVCIKNAITENEKENKGEKAAVSKTVSWASDHGVAPSQP